MICCYKCFYTSEFIFSTEQSPAQTCGLWTTDSPPESPSGPQVDLVKSTCMSVQTLFFELAVLLCFQASATFCDAACTAYCIYTVFFFFFD